MGTYKNVFRINIFRSTTIDGEFNLVEVLYFNFYYNTFVISTIFMFSPNNVIFVHFQFLEQ